MSLVLRIEMIIIAIAFVLFIFRGAKKGKIRLQYALLWLLIALTVVVIAIFPEIIFWLANLMGIQAPSNLLFLLTLIGLLFIVFHLTLIVSRQADRIERLIQLTSIKNHFDDLEKEKNNECNT